MIQDRIRKLFLLFCSIDRRSFFSAIYVIACHALFYLSRNRHSLCERWKNRDVILSFNGTKFAVNVMPGDLGFILSVFVLKEYECEPSFLPLPGNVCLDIGANIGTNSLNWYRYNPTGRIVSVEPHPEVIKRLRRNIEINDCRNIEVHHCAVSDRNGQIEMYMNEGSTMMNAEDTRKSHKYLIPSVTLDSLVQTLGIPAIDLCKIDVEGYEVAVLEGAAGSMQMIRHLIIECHSNNLKNAVQQLLKDEFTLVHESTGEGCTLLFFNHRDDACRSVSSPG